MLYILQYQLTFRSNAIKRGDIIGHSNWRTWVILVLAVGLCDLADRARSQEPTTSVIVHAKRYGFVPSAITLKKGQTVKLILISATSFMVLR